MTKNRMVLNDLFQLFLTLIIVITFLVVHTSVWCYLAFCCSRLAI